MQVHGCYRFNRQYLLVELTLDLMPDEIDWFGFSVLEDGVAEFDRQTPYMEQYLTPDGTDRLCEAWDEPEEQTSPSRVVFFLLRTEGTVLETPYGNVDLSAPVAMPERLKAIVEFEF